MAHGWIQGSSPSDSAGMTRIFAELYPRTHPILMDIIHRYLAGLALERSDGVIEVTL